VSIHVYVGGASDVGRGGGRGHPEQRRLRERRARGRRVRARHGQAVRASVLAVTISALTAVLVVRRRELMHRDKTMADPAAPATMCGGLGWI
jgi:hypothetical protein